MSEAEKAKAEVVSWVDTLIGDIEGLRAPDSVRACVLMSLDALLAAVRAEERETLAMGLDTRAEALAHGHGVAGNISGMSDEEFERRLKAAGKGCTVCARIELLAELAAALREGA